MMETKFGYVQHVEDKTMEVLWLGVMTVMHGITGKTFTIFVDVYDCSVFVYINHSLLIGISISFTCCSCALDSSLSWIFSENLPLVHVPLSVC